MLIICPHCATRHEVPDDYIGEAGRKVRCSGCREIWLAERPAPADTVETAADNADERPGTAETSAESGFDAVPPGDAPESAAPPPQGMPRPAKGRLKRPPPAASKSRFERWPAISIAASVCLLLALTAMRERVVRIAPQMAKLYAAVGMNVNLRGLNLDNVATKLFTEGDAKLLIVAGDVTNPTGHPIALPPLRFALRNDKGLEVYSWTARLDQPELGPGEVLPFKRRLAAPPADGKDVQVRFLSGTDLASLGGMEMKPAETKAPEPKPAEHKPAEASH